MKAHLAVLAAVVVLGPLSPAESSEAAQPKAARTMSFSERVEARRAIEGVLWSHRIWPNDNGSPKPALDAWLPPGALEREIDADLRMSDALARYWGRPITHQALQAELDRIVRDSKAPAVLREIIDALNGDAFLAAEVLARHSLVDRLARSAQAYDGRIHRVTYERAAAQLRHAPDIATLRRAGDRFAIVRYERTTDAGAAHDDDGPVVVRRVAQDEWDARLKELAALRAMPLGVPGPLEERDHEFVASAIVASDADQVTVATAAWPKQSFESWWTTARGGFGTDISVPSGSYVLDPLAPGNPCTDNTWYPLKRDVPGPRYEAVSVWTGVEMIVWGGSTGSGALGTGGRYRPDTDTWTEMSTLGAPSARRRAAAVWTGTLLIVWGGDNGAASPVAFDTGGRYNPALDTWSATSTSPSARTYPTAVWTGSSMIVWGGVNPSTGVAPQTGGVYDPVSNGWTATTTSGAPIGRFGHTAVWLGGEMIVWGGTQGIDYLNTGGRYNPGTNSWAATTTSGAPGARVWHTAVVFAGRMLIWGGERNGTQTWNTGSLYFPDGWQAVTTAGLPPAGREHHAAVVVDDPNAPGNYRMVVFGGHALDALGHPLELNDGGVLRQFQNDWRPINPSGAPTFRTHPMAVSIGRDMITWGGLNGSTALGDGRRYDPFAETWSAISALATPGPVPLAAERETLVSTGSEILVWGGLDSGGGFATGNAKYMPATDSWTALPESGGPTLRYWHSAVWAGTVMIVWGGETPGGPVNTGAYFDLFGWAPLDPTGAPSARRRHTAVWGAHQMIVWGGDAGSTVFNDGAIFFYNPPLGENWSIATAAVSLGSRVYHTAVWTGSRMIVFGGANSGNVWGDGASYNPSTNSWTLLPTTNEPSTRYRHTAVWTGDEMLIWGGSAGLYLDNGASYSPTLDTWQALPATGSPGRSWLPATWTGREMIVWGGLNSSGAAWDGARYNPAFKGWTSMTTVGAPSARFSHPAVQLGDEMYTWGGLNGSSVAQRSGGRYCASVPDLSGFEAAKDLLFSDKTNLVWTGNGAGITYSVRRGTIGAGQPWYNHGCLQGGLATPTLTDATVPPLETGFYYLVAASNGGSSTGLGSSSSGAPRPALVACP